MASQISRRKTLETLALLADGMRWALAAVLVLQVFFRGLAPTVSDVIVALLVARRTGVCAGACETAVSALIPWGVFVAMHLLQARLQRRLGGYPYSDGQIALMALLPGYNLYGSVRLFATHGEAMERLGAGRDLGLELRAVTAIASGLAVASAVVWLRALAPFLHGPAESAPMVGPASARPIVILSVALLMARLYALARLQVASRHLVHAMRSGTVPEPAPVALVTGLPGARTAVPVAALGLLAGGLALLPPDLLGGGLPASATTTAAWAPAFTDGEPASPAPPAPADRPRAEPRPPPGLPADHLLGGRTVEWWRERLTLLQGRTDDEGRRLFALTRERAAANGLVVTEEPTGLRVEPSAELVAGAATGAAR